MSFKIHLPFWGWVAAVVFVVGVGMVSGRILGVQRGAVRASIAGLLGSVVGLSLAALVLRGKTEADDDLGLLGLAFGFALLSTMVLSIAIDVVLRPRVRGRRPRLRTRMRSGLAIGSRLFEVVRIARRRGLAGPRSLSQTALATPEGAFRLRLFLEDCGGMFIKFGQIASTRSDLLPDPLIAQLSDLQSNVARVPLNRIRASIEAELGAPIDEIFTDFSDEPLAAASIGQTHLAVLRDGRPVVVKVRRPDVEVGVLRDSAVFRWASRAASRRFEAARKFGLVPLADELTRSVELELSYLREAANGRTLAGAPGAVGVAVPWVETSKSTDSVLILERVNGRSVADQEAVAACGVPRAELAERLLTAFFNHAMVGGVFHADPHPGNVLIDPQGVLWLIDFGAVGVIDSVTLEALQLMGAGLGTAQPALVVRALRSLSGSAGDSMDPRTLEGEISAIMSEQLQAGGFDPRSLQEIVKVMGRHSIPVPSTLTVLARALVTLEGTLRTINPEVDMAAAAAGLLGRTMRPSLGSVRDVLSKEMLRTLPSIRALPSLTEDIALQLRAGRLRMQIDPFAAESRSTVTRWVDQAIFAAVAVGGILASALILLGSDIAAPNGDPTLRAVGYFGLIISSVMMMRIVAQILRRDTGRERP